MCCSLPLPPLFLSYLRSSNVLAAAEMGGDSSKGGCGQRAKRCPWPSPPVRRTSLCLSSSSPPTSYPGMRNCILLLYILTVGCRAAQPVASHPIMEEQLPEILKNVRPRPRVSPLFSSYLPRLIPSPLLSSVTPQLVSLLVFRGQMQSKKPKVLLRDGGIGVSL